MAQVEFRWRSLAETDARLTNRWSGRVEDKVPSSYAGAHAAQLSSTVRWRLTVIINRILVALEMLLLFPVVLLGVFAYLVGSLGNEPFGAISKLGHLSALFSLLPLSYVTVGYLRGFAEEFFYRFKAMWIAGGAVVITLLAALVGALGGGATGLDVTACLVAVPFVHLLAAGTDAPPNKSLERTRER